MAASSDDSDYGYDLTAEEEDIVSALLANISASASPAARQAPQAPHAPQPSTRSQAPADPVSLGSLPSDDVDFDPSELGLSIAPPSHDPRGSPREWEGELATTGSKRKLAPRAPLRDKRLASFVAKTTAKSTPVAIDVDVGADADGRVPGVNYPDCTWPLPGGGRRYTATAATCLTDPQRLVSRALSQIPDASHQTAESKDDRGQDQDHVPPILRFRTFPRKPFSVSDLTAGAWCEQQYYYTLTRSPFGRKTRTPAMRGGTRVHQNLEDQIYTTIRVDVQKKEDAFGLKLWNMVQGLRTLRDSGLTRELEVWGVLGDEGYVVNGVIDGLSYDHPDPALEEEEEVGGEKGKGSQGSSETAPKERKITEFFPSSSQNDRSKASTEDEEETRQVYIVDVKTRASLHRPGKVQERVTKVQLYFYHRFLADMAADRLDYDAVFRRYGLRPDETFSDRFLAQMAELHDDVGDAASSAAAAEGQPDLVRYHSLAALVPLLRHELGLAFPRGAASLGRVVSVEYRYRSRADPDPDDHGDEPASGAFIGASTFLVDDELLRRYVRHELEWWRGERKPEGVGVAEAFKCRMCEFADDCEWRASQEKALVRAARAKRGR